MCHRAGHGLTANENDGTAEPATVLDSLATYTDAYVLCGVGVILGTALVLWLLVPTLKKWMHGIH